LNQVDFENINEIILRMFGSTVINLIVKT